MIESMPSRLITMPFTIEKTLCFLDKPSYPVYRIFKCLGTENCYYYLYATTDERPLTIYQWIMHFIIRCKAIQTYRSSDAILIYKDNQSLAIWKLTGESLKHYMIPLVPKSLQQPEILMSKQNFMPTIDHPAMTMHIEGDAFYYIIATRDHYPISWSFDDWILMFCKKFPEAFANLTFESKIVVNQGITQGDGRVEFNNTANTYQPPIEHVLTLCHPYAIVGAVDLKDANKLCADPRVLEGVKTNAYAYFWVKSGEARNVVRDMEQYGIKIPKVIYCGILGETHIYESFFDCIDHNSRWVAVFRQGVWTSEMLADKANVIKVMKERLNPIFDGYLTDRARMVLSSDMLCQLRTFIETQ